LRGSFQTTSSSTLIIWPPIRQDQGKSSIVAGLRAGIWALTGHYPQQFLNFNGLFVCKRPG
jgi:hypothetical protein